VVDRHPHRAGLSEGEIKNQCRLGNSRLGFPCRCPPSSLGKGDGGGWVNRPQAKAGRGLGGRA
jgi:hypothetical protein